MIHYQAFHIQTSEDLKWKMPKSDYEEDDLNHEERDYWFWEKAVMVCNRRYLGGDILEWLRDMIRLYKWSQKETYFRR